MRRRKSLSLLAFAVLLLAAVAAFAFLAYRRHAALPVAADTATTGAQPAAPPAAASDAYAAAARAFREGDLDAGRSVLSALAETQPRERERALMVLGLHLYAAGEYEAAEEILQVAGDRTGELEDWRLYALADAAARIGDDALAEAAIGRLLEGSPTSPLRGRALVAAARRAWERGDTQRALSRVDLARSQSLAAGNTTDIDVLAWRIGAQLGDRTIERTAAQRLLVHSPVKASELEVGEIFEDEKGRITSWEGILSQQEVEQRAAGWIAAGRPLAAVNTLDTVPERDRGLDWHLLQARALTEQHKGREAYALLRGMVDAASDEDRARLEWERACAAADVAVARPGRDGLPAAERERMLEVSQKHLRRVVELNVDTATSVSAVRKVYAHLAESGRFDEAMEMLQLLRHLDPRDRTGASYLWEQGWQEFEDRNFSGAVGYWTQLEQIYPGDRDTHRGTYWKARALEELGQERRARQVYRQVVRESDTADFYVRQALARLDGEEEHAQRPGSTAAPWPGDPALRRVLVLSNFGLDKLADLELESAAATATADLERDARALRGILTVRAGNPREGVQMLRAAFPDLGGPFQAGVPRPVLEAYYPLEYEQAIAANAKEQGLPPALVAGIIRQESAFDRKAQSWAGARGLMQIMPATAKEWAARLDLNHSPDRLYDPEYSIRLGSAYFRWVLRRFGGNVELALAGYNGGPNRIQRLWKEAGGDEEELDLFLEQLDISESQAYVKRILVLSDSYRQLYPVYGDGDGRRRG